METARRKSKNKAIKISCYHEHSNSVSETANDYKLLENEIYGGRELSTKCIIFGGTTFLLLAIFELLVVFSL